MKLLVWARAELIENIKRDASLLLEGSWSADTPFASHWSLDEAIDAEFEWIDVQAARLVEQLQRQQATVDNDPFDGISAAYLNALGLRYYLVKLIRLATYFTDIHPLKPGDNVILVVGDGDEDYVQLFGELCRAAEAKLTVCRVQGEKPALDQPPSNPPWRRLAAAACRSASRIGRLATARRRHTSSTSRVVLCGNPRLLQPVCDELLQRGCRVSWLCDRFAVKQWLRRPVEQITCNSSLGYRNRLELNVPERFEFRGVNLAAPLRDWLRRRLALHGSRQTRMVERIDRHFRRIGADAIVLDEDATPLARAAVAVARRHGCNSFVVQHGAPCCRFGFSPVAADNILAWGESSRRKLAEWGVEPERISVTGSPQLDRAFRDKWRFAVKPSTRRGPRVLMLATTAPRDRRPDAVALQLTTAAYRRMLKMAFSTLAEIDGVRLTVKLHPRSRHDPLLEEVLSEFPKLDANLIQGGRLEEFLKDTDCVLSCCSSAGVEAAALGVPVIQLEPPQAADILPRDQWGLIGGARNARQLQQLLIRVLLEGEQPAPRRAAAVFANINRPATKEVVDRILGVAKVEVESEKSVLENVPNPRPLTPSP